MRGPSLEVGRVVSAGLLLSAALGYPEMSFFRAGWGQLRPDFASDADMRLARFCLAALTGSNAGQSRRLEVFYLDGRNRNHRWWSCDHPSEIPTGKNPLRLWSYAIDVS